VLEGDGLVAALEGEPVGLITWLAYPTSGTAEIRAVAVDPVARGRGIGRALFEAAHAALGRAGIRSAWLVTTNDNTPALRLYEGLGYRLVEVRRGAIDEIRRTIKPSIPLVGHGGVEIHDELQLAFELGDPVSQ
jgi:ribosomal protein S18 acetylase RimI-like enzyme